MFLHFVITKLGIPALFGVGITGIGWLIVNDPNIQDMLKNNIFVIAKTTGESPSDDGVDIYKTSSILQKPSAVAGSEGSTSPETTSKDIVASQKKRNYKCSVELNEQTAQEFNCKLVKITVDKTKQKWMYASEITEKYIKKKDNLVAKYDNNGSLTATTETEDTSIKVDDLKEKNHYYAVQMSYGTFTRHFSKKIANKISLKSFEAPKTFGSLNPLFAIYRETQSEDKFLDRYIGTTKHVIGKATESSTGSVSDTACYIDGQKEFCKIFDFVNDPKDKLGTYKKTDTQATEIKKDHFYLIELSEDQQLYAQPQITFKISDPQKATAIFSPAIPVSGDTQDDGFLFVMRKFA